MKKLLCLLMSLMIMVPVFAACNKEKLQVYIADKGGVEVGTECIAPEVTVLSSKPYTVNLKINDPNGYSVMLDEAKKFFVAVGGEYSVEYTVKTEAETVVAKSKISTVDVESPVFKNPITEMRFLKGKEVTIPNLKIVDKGGAIKPVFTITDNEGKTYDVTADYKFMASETAHTYKIKVVAEDKGGNKVEKLMVGYARDGEYEIQGFNEPEQSNLFTTDGGNGTFAGIVDVDGAVGKALKFETAEVDPSGVDWGAYYNLRIKTTGISDLSESEGIVMRVYNHGPELKVYNALGMNATVNPWGDAGYNKVLKANSWNEIKWTKAQLDTLLDGSTYDGHHGKVYTRSTIDNVQELNFFIDNSGYWGSDEGGQGADYTNKKFALYFDSISMIPIDRNWEPVVYETETTKVYEINNFDNIGRIDKLDWMDTDMSKVEYYHVADGMTVDDRPNGGAMRVTFKNSSNFYPNVVMNINKVKTLIGKKLSELPDDAKFVMDIVQTSDSAREGADGGAYGAGGFFRFYKEGSNNEAASKVNGEYAWCAKGEWTTFTISIAQIKEGLKAYSIDDVDRVGFFFYMDSDWGADGASTTFIFDNYRLVVPKS